MPNTITDEEISEIEKLAKKAIQPSEGEYHVSFDHAEECGPHANSGLAKVDTGRSEDWPVARLCEWPTAKFIAYMNPERTARLCEALKQARAEVALARAHVETLMQSEFLCVSCGKNTKG